MGINEVIPQFSQSYPSLPVRFREPFVGKARSAKDLQ
jgi:hypothetical protein